MLFFMSLDSSPVDVLLGLPDEEHVALLALVGAESEGRRDEPAPDQVHVVPPAQLVGVPVFHVVDYLKGSNKKTISALIKAYQTKNLPLRL